MDGDKSAVAILKVYDSWLRISDTEPRESLSILPKSTKVLGSIRRVRFTRAALRHANIRENKGPSLNKIQVKILHQYSPYALKLKDRSQEEIERQERCARGEEWRLAKNIFKLKEKDKATFFSSTNEWCLPAPSVIKTGGKRICCRFRREHAHVEQERPELCRIGNRKGLQKFDDGCYSQRRSAYKRRSDRVCQRIGFIRDSKASRWYTACSLTRKTLPRWRIFLRVDHWPEATAR